jgi:hypothetical protein
MHSARGMVKNQWHGGLSDICHAWLKKSIDPGMAISTAKRGIR